MVATALTEAKVPCNSPCWSSPAVRDMIPCIAGPATEPRAVSGVSASAIQPFVTNAKATNATTSTEKPKITALRSPIQFRIGRISTPCTMAIEMPNAPSDRPIMPGPQPKRACAK